MKIIHKFIEHINDELDGAKEYAEKFIENKAKGNMARAARYKEISEDEMRHATYVKDMAVSDAEDILKVYTLPVETEEAWNHTLKHFAECMAMIRQMLSM